MSESSEPFGTLGCIHGGVGEETMKAIKTFEDLKAKFYRNYANIPIPLREEIVAVVDDEAMTFQVIRIELDNNSDMGRRVVMQMHEIGIL